MISREALENNLSQAVTEALKKEIEAKGRASLAVSGGSTPKNLFKLLSEKELKWENVDVIPIDERLLPEGHKDQNGSLIKQFLLQNKARKATFHPLVFNSKNAKENLFQLSEQSKKINFPLTVAILGMGTDGHTASLFPGSEALQKGLSNTTTEPFINVVPPAAPYERVSMTFALIKKSKHLFLHFYGEEKSSLLEKVKQHKDEMEFPIYAFLKLPNIQIFNTD